MKRTYGTGAAARWLHDRRDHGMEISTGGEHKCESKLIRVHSKYQITCMEARNEERWTDGWRGKKGGGRDGMEGESEREGCREVGCEGRKREMEVKGRWKVGRKGEMGRKE